MSDDDLPTAGETIASHLTDPADDGPRLDYTVEGQERCTNCGVRHLFITSRPYVPGQRTSKRCPDCNTETEHVITVMYNPDEYDLVTPYDDGDIGLRSTCQGCGHDYYGPMLKPCYECGSTTFERWLETDPDGGAPDDGADGDGGGG